MPLCWCGNISRVKRPSLRDPFRIQWRRSLLSGRCCATPIARLDLSARPPPSAPIPVGRAFLCYASERKRDCGRKDAALAPCAVSSTRDNRPARWAGSPLRAWSWARAIAQEPRVRFAQYGNQRNCRPSSKAQRLRRSATSYPPPITGRAWTGALVQRTSVPRCDLPSVSGTMKPPSSRPASRSRLAPVKAARSLTPFRRTHVRT